MNNLNDEGLKVNNIISLAQIDKENYTISLLQHCSVLGVIQPEKILQIKKFFQDEFVETASQYTKRENSTLPRKSADEIYRSVLYQSDIFLLSLSDTDTAVDALKNMSLEKILYKGKDLIMKYYSESKSYYNKARQYNLDLPVYEYRYVMDEAFNKFYKNYSARFNALDVCASIDYPLMNKKPYEMTSRGVVFIKEYYQDIMLENRFCSLFDIDDIRTLLSGYGKIYGCKYTDILFNIAEVVANNYITRLLCNKDGYRLDLRVEDIESVVCGCDNLSLQDVNDMIKKILKRSPLLYHDPQLYMYLKTYSDYFADELLRHITNKNMYNFIVFK